MGPSTSFRPRSATLGTNGETLRQPFVPSVAEQSRRTPWSDLQGVDYSRRIQARVLGRLALNSREPSRSRPSRSRSFATSTS